MRLIPFTPGEYFHVYNRGANKMPIFLDENDYKRFQKLLYTTNGDKNIKFSDIPKKSPYPVWTLDKGEALVEIGAYVLMPNHFHILIRSKNEKGAAIFLHKLLLSYSKYFNKKYSRDGAVFQGKTKAQHLYNERYLRYIYSYIHLNPIKLFQADWKKVGLQNTDGALNYLNSYKNSSFLDYSGEKRIEGAILNTENFPAFFENTLNFKDEINTFLNYEKQN